MVPLLPTKRSSSPLMDSPPTTILSVSHHVNGVHNLWGFVANVDCYLYHYGPPFICPATCPTCYDPAINTEASCVNRVCAKTALPALLLDYKAYKATEHGVKVFIQAVVNDTWICNLRDPETFYSNVTALAIFNHLCKCSGSLHGLNMVLLTIQMIQYYEGTPDIPEYIFLLEDAQHKAARLVCPSPTRP